MEQMTKEEWIMRKRRLYYSLLGTAGVLAVSIFIMFIVVIKTLFF